MLGRDPRTVHRSWAPAMALVLCALSATSACWAKEKIVIAHRGASGYLPEHTLEAYAVAHAMGADYVEQDVVLCKDQAFICLHDIHLEATTDVEEVFPDRSRGDGRWYAADFTLEEVKTLKVHERLPGRFPKGKADFEVPTFIEAIELIQGLNATTGREVGIYPELKAPSWHQAQGLPMEDAFLSLLSQHGYTEASSKVFVQCFEAGSLKRMREELGSTLPQIQLIPAGALGQGMLAEENLERIATYANGIGPAKECLLACPEAVKRAHELGLLVHPYTVRADDVAKPFTSCQEELQDLYFKRDVDGLFTDFPDLAARALAGGLVR